jgi:hypothetical protein
MVKIENLLFRNSPNPSLGVRRFRQKTEIAGQPSFGLVVRFVVSLLINLVLSLSLSLHLSLNLNLSLHLSLGLSFDLDLDLGSNFGLGLGLGLGLSLDLLSLSGQSIDQMKRFSGSTVRYLLMQPIIWQERQNMKNSGTIMWSE